MKSQEVSVVELNPALEKAARSGNKRAERLLKAAKWSRSDWSYARKIAGCKMR